MHLWQLSNLPVGNDLLLCPGADSRSKGKKVLARVGELSLLISKCQC